MLPEVKDFIDEWTKKLFEDISAEIDQEIRIDLGSNEEKIDFRKDFANKFKKAVSELNNEINQTFIRNFDRN